ncbi:MAG: hypothetical protein HZA79_11345 [Sphingobacteriales bacterium]|nr:hypothetical protein [Sphingobacteriales bacterium]
MKKHLMAFSLVLLLTGCKKAIQNAQEDLVIRAMTDGQWVITSFTLNSADISSDFTNYRFKYYSNKTVDAIHNGAVEKTGTWEGNANAMSIWANFASPPYPLTLINGTWQITRNSWTYVEASQTSGTDIKTLRLDKQ